MKSKFHSIFLLSVVGGTWGLAFADTIPTRFSGGVGFIVGLLGSFALLSFLAIVSDVGRSQGTVTLDNSIENQVRMALTQKLVQETVPQHPVKMQLPINH